MNYEKIMIEYGHIPVEQLPPEIRSKVEGTPQLLEYWAESARLQKRLRESVPIPDDAAVERLVSKVRNRLEQPPSDRRDVEKNTILFPIMRWLAVAACAAIAFVGVYRIWMPDPTLAIVNTSEERLPLPVEENPVLVVPQSPLLAGTDTIRDAQSVSNHPPRIDYRRNSMDGGGASPIMPVSNPIRLRPNTFPAP